MISLRIPPSLLCVPFLLAGVVRAASDAPRADRPPELWRDYMHGIPDWSATPIDLAALFSDARPGDVYAGAARTADPDAAEQDETANDPRPAGRPSVRRLTVKIETPFKKIETAALALGPRTRLPSATPLPIPAALAAGHGIRLFLWVRGDKTGAENSPNSYSDPANFFLSTRDAAGRQLTCSSSLNIGTTGTFPWHCYSADFFIPQNAATLRLELANKRGTATFAALSWERITAANTYSARDRQDPVTGSSASNVLYDELNRQFTGGGPPAFHTWNFFRGPAAGLVGQRYDVTTPDGLARYFREKVKRDNDHMNHSLMYFASRYHIGAAVPGVLPPGMDEAWFRRLTQLILDDQDPATGYWGTAHEPVSMGITFHFLDGLFSYYNIHRADRPDTTNPRRALAVREIPRADAIARTTLAMQATRANPDGTRRLAAWPRSAYNFTRTPDAATLKHSNLAVTNNAIRILRHVERFVSPDLKRAIYDAIKAATRDILETCMAPDGAWRQSDTDPAPSNSSYFPGLLDASYYVERRIDPSVPAPHVAVVPVAGNRLRVVWSDPAPDHNSLRLYALPPGMTPGQLDETRLVGIIHRAAPGAHLWEMDPLLAARKIGDAARAHWGKNWNLKSYLGEKIRRRLPSRLPVSDALAPLEVTLPAGARLFASGVTWYGEESAPVGVPLP